jgi:hypothetical protein
MNKPLVRIEHVWDDYDLLEVKVTARNGRFGGATEVYSTVSALKDLARGIKGFPRSLSAHFAFDIGDDGRGRSVGLAFSCHRSAGQVAVTFSIQDGTDRVESHLIVEPGAIDRFHTALVELCERKAGNAEMEGENA